MCYKLTSIFGIPHGQAAIICNKVLYKWMIDNISNCIDSRGEKYLLNVLDDIAIALGEKNAVAGADKFCEIIDSMEFDIPQASEEQYVELKNSVNPDRLKNFPIKLDVDTIDMLYHNILR